jgi:hypothetical protein
VWHVRAVCPRGKRDREASMIKFLALLAALFALAPTQAYAQASVILYCYNGATPNITVPCPTSGGTALSKSGTYASSGTGQMALAISTNTQLTVPSGTTCAQITIESASVRRTSDGSSASTTNGTLIAAGASWQDCGPLAAYKFTAVSGSPTLDVEYFK